MIRSGMKWEKSWPANEDGPEAKGIHLLSFAVFTEAEDIVPGLLVLGDGDMDDKEEIARKEARNRRLLSADVTSNLGRRGPKSRRHRKMGRRLDL